MFRTRVVKNEIHHMLAEAVVERHADQRLPVAGLQRWVPGLAGQGGSAGPRH